MSFASAASSARAIALSLLEDEPPAENPGGDDLLGLDPREMVHTAADELERWRAGAPDYQGWLAKIQAKRGGYRDRIKLERNTWAILHPDGDIGIRLHATDIITIHPNNTLTVDNGGWDTMVTMARLNDYLPAGWGIFTHQGEWFWYVRTTGLGTDNFEILRARQPYTNGDEIDEDGVLHPKQPAQELPPKRKVTQRPPRHIDWNALPPPEE